MVERHLDLTDLSFVPGPRSLPERFSSVDLGHLENYPLGDIADAFLSVPGVRLTHPPDPTWYDWRARWLAEDRFIDIGFTTCDVDLDVTPSGLVWGGSELRTHCLLADLLTLWRRVRECCPAVWLHDAETLMWSPESFEREVRAIRAGTTGPSVRPGWGAL